MLAFYAGRLRQPDARSGATGCLLGLCVSGTNLYVSTNHGALPRILCLPRTQEPPAPTDRAAGGTAVKEGLQEGLSFKRGFLLGSS